MGWKACARSAYRPDELEQPDAHLRGGLQGVRRQGLRHAPLQCLAALEHEWYGANGANLYHIAEVAAAIQEGIRKVLGLPEICHNTGVA
jgi:hypothetical protein